VVVQIRAAALTATQCASYDLAKQWWMRQTGMNDNVGTHFGASMLTGLATTTITAPVDLVKTNMFVGEPSLHELFKMGSLSFGSTGEAPLLRCITGGKRYTSVLHCASSIIKEDGPMGLLKGWTAQYIRLGPQTMVMSKVHFLLELLFNHWSQLS
jgi:solute carrier family 25 uncoupling protein 8/9